MDLWAVHVRNTTRTSFWLRDWIPDKPISRNFGKTKLVEIRVLRRTLYSSSSTSSSSKYHSLVVRATAKKNNDRSSSPGNGDQSIPEGDGSRRNNASDGNKSNESASQKSFHVNMDWREFRANLFRQEQSTGSSYITKEASLLLQAEKTESDGHNQDAIPQEPKSLGLKWAHPIPVPETGCVLVATEKLDGVRTFERTVVLLLRCGTRHPQEGPFGVVINRPLHKKIKHMKPTNNELATTFADCSLHFGGPLEASMFLLRTDEKSKLPGFEEVMPGICFGARNSLDEAAGLVKKGMLKPEDFRFFVGYAGWQLDQLREEIESDYWYVAACSSNLICGGSSDSSESLWEDILQLMGGHYSELSRKPKQDM